jgi:hypothetical protein
MNPFPVMMHCQWADGSFDDEPAFGIVSGDTSMVSITANANGDSMATITPADSQSHLVAITGPPTLVTDCPACSADDVTPQGSVPVPGNPAQLLVIGDTTTFPTNCPNTKIRIVAYQIQDASSVDFKINIPTKEQFGSKSSNTCNTTITTSEICSDTPSGIIHDTLSVGCNSVGGSCGYTYANQQWVFCKGPASSILATIGDLVVHNNSISVAGTTSSLKGRVFRP